ncbi:MAG: hypothetical protein ACYCWE_08625 [Eubacteriales bacterium]
MDYDHDDKTGERLHSKDNIKNEILRYAQDDKTRERLCSRDNMRNEILRLRSG